MGSKAKYSFFTHDGKLICSSWKLFRDDRHISASYWSCQPKSNKLLQPKIIRKSNSDRVIVYNFLYIRNQNEYVYRAARAAQTPTDAIFVVNW